MKTIMMALLTVASFGAKAQYTEKMFDQAMKRYSADPITFLKDEATLGFEFVGGNGKKYNTQQTVDIYKKYEELPRKFEELKIVSDQKMAVVKGTFQHKLRDRNTGNTLNSKVLFQYVMVEEGGKWKVAMAQHTDSVP